MALKDIPSWIGLLSLPISIVVFGYTTFKGKRDDRRVLRNSLNDTFKEISRITLSMTKENHRTPQGSKDSLNVLWQDYLSLLDRAMLLVSQMESLVPFGNSSNGHNTVEAQNRRTPFRRKDLSVTSIEYCTLAVANYRIGRFLRAEECYKAAISVAPDDEYRARTTSSYASFLFTQQLSDAGRDKHKEALKLLSTPKFLPLHRDSDETIVLRGLIKMIWARDERDYAKNELNSNIRFSDSEDELHKINNLKVKNSILNILKSQKIPLEKRAAEPAQKIIDSNASAINIPPIPETPSNFTYT